MHTSAQHLYTQALNAHRELYETIVELTKKVRVDGSLESQADTVYAIKLAKELIEDCETELNKLDAIAVKMMAALWVRKGDGESIRTEYATVTPTVGMHAKVPKLKTDPEAYFAFTDHFGIPRDIAEQDLVRVHWPRLVEHLTGLAEEGKPLPPGMDPSSMVPVYSAKVTAKRKTPDE